MFNSDLALALCKQMAVETDLQKLRALNALLVAVLKDDLEEIRLRAAFLRSKYNIGADEVRA